MEKDTGLLFSFGNVLAGYFSTFINFFKCACIDKTTSL